MEEKILWLRQLSGMENPMRNLIDVMRNAVSELAYTEGKGVAQEYNEVFDLLRAADDNIRKAVKKATDITYKTKG